MDLPLPSFGKLEPTESMTLVLSEEGGWKEEDRTSSPIPFQFGFQAPSPTTRHAAVFPSHGDSSSLTRRDTSRMLTGNGVSSSPASSFRLQRMGSSTMRGGQSNNNNGGSWMGSLIDLGASAREESRSLSPVGRRNQYNHAKSSSAGLKSRKQPNNYDHGGMDGYRSINSPISSHNLLRGAGMQIPRSYICIPGSEPLEVDAVGCIEPERLMVVHGTMFDDETTMENRIEATMGAAAIAERAAKRNRMRNIPVMNRARRVKRSMMASVMVAHAIFALQIEASRNLAKARGTLIRLLVPIIVKRRFVRERMRRRYMIQSDAFSKKSDGGISGGLPDRPTPEDLARAVPMFGMLGRYSGILPALINEMECLAFDEAEHIIRQGESSSNLYFVARGTCVERAVVRNARKTSSAPTSTPSTTPQHTTAPVPITVTAAIGSTAVASPSQPQLHVSSHSLTESKPDTELPSAHALSPARAYNLNGGRRNSIIAAHTAAFKKVRGSRSSLTLGRGGAGGGSSLHESLVPPSASSAEDGHHHHGGPPRSRSHSLSCPPSRRLSAANTTPPTSTTVPVKSFPIPSDNRLLLYGGIDGDGVATSSGGALIESSTSVLTGYASPVHLQPTEPSRKIMSNTLSTGTLRGTFTGNMLATLATVGKAIGKFLHSRTTQMYEGARYGSGAVFGSVFGIPIAHSCSIVVTSPEAVCWMLSHDAFQRIIFGSMGGMVGFCREIVSAENAPIAKGTDIHARLGALHAAKTNTISTTSPSTLLLAAITSSATATGGGPRPPTTSHASNPQSPSPRRVQLLHNNNITMNLSHASPRLSCFQPHQQPSPITASSALVPPEAISELREAYIRQCIATIPLGFPIHLSLTTVRKVPYWNELETPSQLLPHFVNPPSASPSDRGVMVQMALIRGPTLRGGVEESTSPAAEAAHASVSGGKWLDGFHLGKLTPVVFEKGDHLYKSGVHCPFVYLLLAGEVQLVQDDVPWRGIVLGEEEATGTPFNPLGVGGISSPQEPMGSITAPSSPLTLPHRRDHLSPTGQHHRGGRSASPRAASTHHRAWSPAATTAGGGRTSAATSPDHHHNSSPQNNHHQHNARTSNIAVGSLLRLSRTKAFVWLGHHSAILPEIPQHTCVATSDIVKVYAMDRLHFLDTLVEEPGLLGRVRDEMLQARASKLLFRSLHWFNYAPLLCHVPYWARADYVAKGIRPRVIAPGTVIANQFDTVKYMYFIASGTVRILPRIHSTTRVLNEPPLASWHAPLHEPSNTTTMASHTQRRKAASYQEDAEVTMLLNPATTHIIDLPKVVSSSLFDEDTTTAGSGTTSPRRPSGRRVSDRVSHTVSKAAANAPPTTCSPDLQCSWFDVDGPYLHTLLPPSAKLLKPRPAVGTTPHCTSLLQAAAQAAQVAHAREAGSASPPHRGGGGRGGRTRSPTLDATSTVMWNSPDKTRGTSMEAQQLAPHTSSTSPEMTAPLPPTNINNAINNSLALDMETSNGAFTNEDVEDPSSSLVHISSGGGAGGATRRVSQELVGGTQYPASIIGYLNPRQAQTLRHLLAEEEAMAAIVAKTVPPIKYVLGGSWEGLIADKWADTYEAASVVELWEVPIEGLRNAFEKGACVSRGAMVEAARRHQMGAVGLDVPLSAPLPPLLPSQRVLSNAGLTGRGKQKDSSNNSSMGITGTVFGVGRLGGCAAEPTRKRGLSTATISDGTSSEAAAYTRDTTPITNTAPPSRPPTLDPKQVEGCVKSNTVFRDNSAAATHVVNDAVVSNDALPPSPPPKTEGTLSESPADKPPVSDPTPQTSTTTSSRSALPPRGGGPPRPAPLSSPLHTATNRRGTPGTSGGALGRSGSGRVGGGEVVRVRRGSTLDGILCDGIEDLLDPTGASSVNVGRVVSVNVEDTAVCGGSGRLEDGGGTFEVGSGDPYHSRPNTAAAASMSYHSNPSSRSWWSNPHHEDEPSRSIRPEDIEVDESLKKNGLLNPAAMLKQLHEERVAEDKKVEDVKRAKLAALQYQITARAMEGAKLKKKRYSTSKHSDELARIRLEVSLDMELEQRKLAWDEKKREERLMAGLVKPQLRAGIDIMSSPPLASAATTVPFSPMRVRTNVVLPSSPRNHQGGDDLSSSRHRHQPSPPLQFSHGSFNSASSPGRKYQTTTSSTPSTSFTLPKSVHLSNSATAATARLPLPPGLEDMTSSSSPGRGAASAHSRRPVGGSLRGKATIAVSTYVPPPTPREISPRSMSSKSATSPRGGLASLGVRLPYAAL